MAFQRSAVHLKSSYAEENEQTSEVAEHELTHLEISLKIALHSPAVFLRFCQQLIMKCQAKQPETVSSIYWLSPGLTATLRVPTHPNSAPLHSSLHSLLCMLLRQAFRKGRSPELFSAPIFLVKISVSLTFEEKSLQHFPEMFTLISRHLIRHSVVLYNSKTVFVVLGGGKSL